MPDRPVLNSSAMCTAAYGVPASPLDICPASAPSFRSRALAAMAVAVVSGGLCYAILNHLAVGAWDFNWALRAARDLLAGQDPYARPFAHTIPYPLPAAIAAMPFVHFRDAVAGGLFFGISSGLLALGLTRGGFARLLIFLAYPYWAAMLTVQWSPLVTAGALISWLLPATIAKPQIGLPVFLTHLSRRGLIACILVALFSLLLMPTWPARWLSEIGNYEYFIPILLLPGPALLLALLHRNDRDSHLLVLLAMAPQRWFYESFVLWVIPRQRREILATAALSWVAGIWRWYHMPSSWSEVGQWTLWWIYLPMLGIILLRPSTRPGPALKSAP
jgi:hypothetical protein